MLEDLSGMDQRSGRGPDAGNLVADWSVAAVQVDHLDSFARSAPVSIGGSPIESTNPWNRESKAGRRWLHQNWHPGCDAYVTNTALFASQTSGPAAPSKLWRYIASNNLKKV